MRQILLSIYRMRKIHRETSKDKAIQDSNQRRAENSKRPIRTNSDEFLLFCTMSRLMNIGRHSFTAFPSCYYSFIRIRFQNVYFRNLPTV